MIKHLFFISTPYNIMDTMFTLQHHQLLSDHHHHRQSNFNSAVSSTSSISSTDHQYHHQQPQDQSCLPSFFMEQDQDLSSSSSLQQSYSPPHQIQPHFQKQFSTEFSNSFSSNGWSTTVLLEAARAVSDNNSARLHQLMWMLNELSSPYGDVDEKLTCNFLHALFSRMTDSGELNYQHLSLVSKKANTFESTRELMLKFQEVSPWTTFGHVACNGAILEALEGENKLHIVDVSNTYCTQWPTLLEAIATRADEPPYIRLTTVITSKSDGGDGNENETNQTIMREIRSRLEKFARLMCVPFKFNLIYHKGDLSDLDFSRLAIEQDEALAVNFNGTLRSVKNHRRGYLFSVIRNLSPRIVTIVEEEADFEIGFGFPFLRGFEECLRWFRVYFEALDESFEKTSNERLKLEREAGRAVMDLVACSPENSVERRETAERWSSRMRGSGFGGVLWSEEGCEDVRALLRRYKDGWLMGTSETVAGMFLMRRGTPVVWASAWRPV